MEEINLNELFQYFKSKMIWVLVAVIAVILVGNIYTVIKRVPLYSSTATLLLVTENQTAVSQGDVVLNESLIDTYSELIKSRRVLDKVSEELELDYTYSDLYKMITISKKEGTQIINLNVSNEDSKFAKEIANATADIFASEIRKIYKLDNVEIIDEAEQANKPYNLTFVKDNVIYLLAGLVLSCSVIFILYYFDTTIKSADTIEDKLGLAVIGIVPEERMND